MIRFKFKVTLTKTKKEWYNQLDIFPKAQKFCYLYFLSSEHVLCSIRDIRLHPKYSASGDLASKADS